MRKVLLQLLIGLLIFINLTLASAEEPSTLWYEVGERWAVIMFSLSEAQQVGALTSLSQDTKFLLDTHPRKAEPLIMHAAVISSLGEILGGFDGLKLAKEAKLLLDQAEQINPNVLNGLTYTLQGALYYKVPGWPLGFGDSTKALACFQKALNVDPDNIDANYFYGDFLLQKGDYQKAKEAFNHVLSAPVHQLRPITDKGRKKDALSAIAKATELLSRQ